MSSRRTAIVAPSPTPTTHNSALYCFIEGCSTQSLYCCEICKNYMCLKHKNYKTNYDSAVCTSCTFNPDHKYTVMSIEYDNYLKNKRSIYFQKFIDFISLEWLSRKCRKEVQPVY